jgi:TPR repeat protein
MMHYFFTLLFVFTTVSSTLVSMDVPRLHLEIRVNGDDVVVETPQTRAAAQKKAEEERKKELAAKEYILSLITKGESGEKLSTQEMMQLATAYMHGKYGISHDKEKSLFWLTAVAEQTENIALQSRACYSLGMHYVQLKDTAQARIYFTRAVSQDQDRLAQQWASYQLGLLSEDPQEKEHLLEKAAKQTTDEK